MGGLAVATKIDRKEFGSFTQLYIIFHLLEAIYLKTWGMMYALMPHAHEKLLV